MRPTAIDVRDPVSEAATPHEGHPSQPVVAAATTLPDAPPAREVPSLAELLATVQNGQPLVAAGPASNGAAGREASARLVEALGAHAVPVSLPDGAKDPGDLALTPDGDRLFAAAIRAAVERVSALATN